MRLIMQIAGSRPSTAGTASVRRSFSAFEHVRGSISFAVTNATSRMQRHKCDLTNATHLAQCCFSFIHCRQNICARTHGSRIHTHSHIAAEHMRSHTWQQNACALTDCGRTYALAHMAAEHVCVYALDTLVKVSSMSLLITDG